MKLRELFESQHHDAAIIFGRFNPPHFGHKGAWEVASGFPIWYIGTNQSTQDAKNPLPFDIKVKAMEDIMPEIKGHLVAEQTWWSLATMVYKKHGAVTLHVVTDPEDAKVYVEQLKKYNGIEGNHGFYKFKDVVWAEAKRASSATDLRNAVAQDNPHEFEKAAGMPADTMIAGHPYFELVKHYMSPYLHAAAEKERMAAEKAKLKAEKEAAKASKKQKVAAEDAAGVGIITKQNTTADVNASTPGKNLKAFNLVKEANRKIREARATLSEKLSVQPSGKMNKHHVDGSQGYTLTRDVGGYDRTYHLNRFWMATAMADGKSKKPVDMDASSFAEKYNVAFPYTDEEQMMIFQAMATIPTDGQEMEKRGKSKEPDDTNKVSAVAKPKRNKYGI
jgi:nicotinamide mononucleotide adenylyltransferase